MTASNRPVRRLPGFLWRGATVQLFLLVVLPLTVLLFAVIFVSISLHNQAMRSLVGDRDLRAVRAAASSLNQAFFHQSASVELLAASAGSDQAFLQLVQTKPDVVSSFDQGVVLFGPDGRILAASPTAQGWLKSTESMQSFLQESRSGVRFSPVFPGSAGHPYLAFVAAPTADGNLIVGAYSPDQLIRATLKDMLGAGQVTAWVITAQQQLVYQQGSLPAQENPVTHPGTSSAIAGESGINYDQTAQGEHVVAFSPIPEIGWALVMEEPWESVAGPMLTTTQVAPLVLVPVVLLMILAIWFGLHQIVTPIKKLEAQAGELAEGHFDSIREPVGGVPEIQNLQAELAQMADQLEAAQESLHSYIGAITAGVENERRSLARELHDDTLQALIALNQRIQLARMRLAEPGDQGTFKDAEQLVQEAMTNLRRLVRGLRPIYLEDLGLVPSLEMLVNETSQNSGLDIQMSTSGTECRLSPETEMALYRMTQEALRNVVRHAQASQAWVEMKFDSENVFLSVRDNGKGFVPPTSPTEFVRMGHYGLLGLYERAELAGARLKIQASPGKGTLIIISLSFQSPKLD